MIWFVPEGRVDCKFAKEGCEVKPKRKDLESHLDANTKKDLSQLMTACTRENKSNNFKLLNKAIIDYSTLICMQVFIIWRSSGIKIMLMRAELDEPRPQ